MLSGLLFIVYFLKLILFEKFESTANNTFDKLVCPVVECDCNNGWSKRKKQQKKEVLIISYE